jgi:hypothetical protein
VPHVDTLLTHGRPAPGLTADKAQARTAAATAATAGRKRKTSDTAAGDVLSRLPASKQQKTVTSRQSNTATAKSAKKASRSSPAPKHAKPGKPATVAATSKAWPQVNKENVVCDNNGVEIDMNTSGGGYDNFPDVHEGHCDTSARKPLTAAEILYPRGAKKTPTAKRTISPALPVFATPQAACDLQPVGGSKSRMRTPADQLPSGAAAQHDKENAAPPGHYGISPAPSQAGTHSSSKRKFGRPIQPVPISGVDWLAVDDPEEDPKMSALQKKRAAALGNAKNKHTKTKVRRVLPAEFGRNVLFLHVTSTDPRQTSLAHYHEGTFIACARKQEPGGKEASASTYNKGDCRPFRGWDRATASYSLDQGPYAHTYHERCSTQLTPIPRCAEPRAR